MIATIIPFIQHSFIDWFSFLLLATIKLIQLFILIFSSKPCPVFSQSHSLDTLCTSFQAKWRIQVFWLKFAQKMDLGLEFQKTNLRIRISILKIFVWNLRKLISRKESTSSRYCVCMCVCASFQAKQTVLTFSAQIYPKVDLGLAIVGMRISILDISCVPIFRQNEKLWIFRPKFAQKRI